MRWMLALPGLLLGAACSGGAPAQPDPAATEELVVRGEAAFLLTGDTIDLTVRTSGGTTPGPGEISWTTSDPGVAGITDDGRLAGRGQGRVTVTATRDGAVGEASFDVWLGRGLRVPGMVSYDGLIPALMARWGIPGGAVAVVKDGRLVYARSYGMADPEEERPVEPSSLFRVASVSKPVTAAAVLLLAERGRLDLDAPAFGLLPDLQPPDGEAGDARLPDITVRHLLHHAGGWDRSLAFDPMFRPGIVAEAVGVPAPAGAEAVIRYMLGQPLQFAPGSRYAYSNFGYAVLGRIVERIAGTPYETFVREEVLAPAGIDRMRTGRSRDAEALSGEVRYHDPAVVQSVFPGEGQVPLAYGGFHLEAMDAHGGWVASAPDLLRFLVAVDGRPVPEDLLAAGTVDLMTSQPVAPSWAGSPFHYGMGWLVRPVEGDANWWHDGSLPGTTALLVRGHGGVSWAALFNRRASSGDSSFAAELDAVLWEALEGVAGWPDHDLFLP